MRSYDRIAELAVEIDGYSLEARELSLSPEFTRRTTIVHLAGGGEEGLGEDVTYDEGDQRAQAAGPAQPLVGRHTLVSFSSLLDGLDLWPSGPGLEAYRDYRRWAYESAALDLALRQAGRSLAEVLERPGRPVTFVKSMGLGAPPSFEPAHRWLELYPGVRLKLDARSDWDEALMRELAATGAVDSIDLKGAYSGTPVDQPADPVLYERVVRFFPGAWIEDPALTPETDAVLLAHRERITWDAPIHSVADVEALAFPPRMVNIKPSRSGRLETLFELYDFCERAGIRAYGGGQTELGPGRGQIQLLASLFHPDGPNDVAPGGYNDPEPRAGLPESPLEPRFAALGFRWA